MPVGLKKDGSAIAERKEREKGRKNTSRIRDEERQREEHRRSRKGENREGVSSHLDSARFP